MADATSGLSMDSLNSILGTSSGSRISGLVSGIDIDSVVAKMMLADSQPLFQMQQQLQIMEWQRDDYRSMNTLLDGLKTTTSSLKLDASFQSKKTTSSNESVVTATAGSTANNATYTFSDVQMATAAQNVSSGSIALTDVDNFDPDTTSLADAGLAAAGSTVTFSLTTYDAEGNKQTKDFEFDADKTTLNQVMSSISSADIGVNAFYDESTGKVSLTRTEAGDLHGDDDHEINITDTSGFLKDKLKITEDGEKSGTDASFTVNGVNTTRSSNTFTLNGTTFTLTGNSTNTTSVQVSNDTDAIYKKISDFVDQYNDVVKQINTKVNEKRDRDYAPLTDVQKKDMSETDITNWTDKAKAGMLFSDDILQSALTQMRQGISEKVGDSTDPSTIDTLAEIGISTGYMSTDGTLEIDETKLKDALNKDPQTVINLFTQNGSGTTDTTGKIDSSAGVMERLTSTIDYTIKQIEQKAGNDTMADTTYYMGNDIKDLNDRITAFKDHLQDVEDHYYSQFTAMEEAIQNANQQASYIQGFTSN